MVITFGSTFIGCWNRRPKQHPGLRRAEEREFQGVYWSSEKWYWEVQVPDRNGGHFNCGFYDTQLEAARVADIAQLALDQMYPDEGPRCWQRNLPKETIYQDEVDKLRGLLAQG